VKENDAAAMALSQAAPLAGLRLVREGRLQTLGFLIDRLPGMLVFAESRRFLEAAVANARVTAILTTPELASEVPEGMGVVVSERPKRDFFRLQNALVATTDFYGATPSVIDPSALVHPRAVVAERGVVIGPGAVVDAGAVLGANGFQTYRGEDGFLELSHAGTLVLGEGVRVLANATVARGLFRQATRIGRETRIGNNAFVSHNVTAGARSFVGHGAVVNGNCEIGDDVWIGPGAVIADRLSIGDGARVSLGSVVIRAVAKGEHVSGNFAIPHRQWLRAEGAKS
jgi:UDP-3-O-[3-hydroxymyristoyl] glucosamine N-acyltransferase